MGYIVQHLFGKSYPKQTLEEVGLQFNVSRERIRQVLKKGAKWAIDKGYGKESDLDAIEEFGCLQEADPLKVSDKAIKRGSNQLGTLGSGNHFIEIGIIKNIFDDDLADTLKLKVNIA